MTLRKYSQRASHYWFSTPFGLRVRCNNCGGAYRRRGGTTNCPYCRSTSWSKRK